MATDIKNMDISTPPPGKLPIKDRLNSRTVPYTLSSDAGPNTDLSSAASAETRTTCKAVSPANLQSLAKIPRLQAPLAEGVQTGAANSPAINGGAEDADTPDQPPNPTFSSSTSSRGGTSAAYRGAPHGTARGIDSSARGGRGSGSTSAAAYSIVADAPKNFIIHVYKLRDELSPLLKEGDFNNIRDIIKAAIWASYAEHGVDRNLSVNNWA
jgi:hypothetical protein